MTDSHIPGDEVTAMINKFDEESRPTVGDDELDPHVLAEKSRERLRPADGGPIS